MINCFIIAAISADGFIDPKENTLSTIWTSKEDKRFFVEKTKQAGVIVMGSTTFETFGSKPLKERKNIVYSKNKKYEGAETTSETPQELLNRLEKEGFKEVAICGGTSIYTLFMESGLVNKIYLTVENILFGSGKNLLNKPLQKKLNLVSSTKLGDNTILLEYSVHN